MKLNAGCGRDYREGWVNLDAVDKGKVDVVQDLTDLPLPFPDNHFERILLDNVMEHLPKHSLRSVLEELHRILRINGQLEIIVPWGITFEIDHLSMFTEYSLNTMLINPIRWKGENMREPVRGDTFQQTPLFRCIECSVKPFRTPFIPINIFRQKLRWLLQKVET